MMYLSTTNKNETIKSNELVEIINQFRELEGGKAELLHKTFMEKIRNEVKTLESLGLNNQQNFLPVEYLDAKGEKRPCFELTRDGMLQMLNSESALVRYKTIDYINTLEEKVKIQNIDMIQRLENKIDYLTSLLDKKEKQRIANKKQQLKIKPPLDVRLENITLDIVNQIVSNSISKGFLKTDKEGIAIDKDILFHEASKFNIKKHDIKIKLELLNKIIYKQVRMNGVPKWCIVFKNNVV